MTRPHMADVTYAIAFVANAFAGVVNLSTGGYLSAGVVALILFALVAGRALLAATQRTLDANHQRALVELETAQRIHGQIEQAIREHGGLEMSVTATAAKRQMH